MTPQSAGINLQSPQSDSTPWTLTLPTGVALMQNGNLAIADYDNKCVTVFEPSGKYVNRIGVGKLLGQYISLQFCFL